MEKPLQNTQERLNKLETEIEALRLKIGDAMRITNEARRQEQMDQLLKERLSKIAEYKALGGSNSRTIN